MFGRKKALIAKTKELADGIPDVKGIYCFACQYAIEISDLKGGNYIKCGKRVGCEDFTPKKAK